MEINSNEKVAAELSKKVETLSKPNDLENEIPMKKSSTTPHGNILKTRV